MDKEYKKFYKEMAVDKIEWRGKTLMLKKLERYIPADELDAIKKELYDQISSINKLMDEIKRG